MANPYITGTPVTGSNFYGRQDLVENLLDINKKSIYLAGNRRMGKTSLLRLVKDLVDSPKTKDHRASQAYYQQWPAPPEDVAIFYNLQSAGSGGLLKMGQDLARLAQKEGTKFRGLRKIKFAEGADLCQVIVTLSDVATRANFQLVLLFDEAEKLTALDNESLEHLGNAIQNASHVRTILAATRRLHELYERSVGNGSSFLTGFINFPVSPFSREEAEKLIRQDHNYKTVIVNDTQVQEILDLAGTHPYLIQNLCFDLYQPSGTLRSIQASDRSYSAQLASVFNDNYNTLTPIERDILQNLAQRGGATEDGLKQALTTKSAASIGAYLKSLIAYGEIIVRDDKFQIANDYFRQWISKISPDRPNNTNSDHPRVLVVDNDPRVRADLKSILENYDVLVVNGTGNELIRNAKLSARTFRPHVAILEMHLLDEHSKDYHSSLSLIGDLSPARCILYSAYLGSEEVRKAFEAGAYSWVGKQEDPLLLVKGVEKALVDFYLGDLEISLPPSWSSGAILSALFGPEHQVPENLVGDVIRQLFPQSQTVALQTYEVAPKAPAMGSRAPYITMSALCDDRREPVVVKFAPAMNIAREHANYQRYIDGNLQGSFYAIVIKDPVLFWDLGALKYRLADQFGQFSASAFASFYARQEKPTAIIKPLAYFFDYTWGGFYRDSQLSQESLYASYEKVLGLEDKFARFQHQDEYWSHPAIENKVFNPIAWVERNKNGNADIKTTRQAITQGDLHGDNLIVSDDYAWVMNFERSGPGPILNDFTELEIDIITRLLPGEGITPEQYYEFILSLVQPSKSNQEINISKTIRSNKELHKAAEVINGLRKIAVNVTNFSDMREYYWGLLLHAVCIAGLTEETHNLRDRVMLVGSLLCHRLENWGKKWPSPKLSLINPRTLEQPSADQTTLSAAQSTSGNLLDVSYVDNWLRRFEPGKLSPETTALRNTIIDSIREEDYEKANRSLILLKNVSTNISDKLTQAETALEIGILYRNLKDYDHAKRGVKKSITLYPANSLERAVATWILGILEYEQNNLDAANSAWHQSRDLFQSLHSRLAPEHEDAKNWYQDNIRQMDRVIQATLLPNESANQRNALEEYLKSQQISPQQLADNPSLLSKFLAVLCEQLGADCAVIYPYKPGDDHVFYADRIATYGLLQNKAVKEKPRTRGLSAYVRQFGEVIVHDVDAGDITVAEYLQKKRVSKEKIQGLLKATQSAPFIHRELVKAFIGISVRFVDPATSSNDAGEEVGLFYINYRAPHKFTPDEIDLIRWVAGQLAPLLQSTNLYIQQQKQKLQEERLQLIEALKTRLESADSRSENPWALVVEQAIKLINAQYGTLFLRVPGQRYLTAQALWEKGQMYQGEQIPENKRSTPEDNGIVGRAARTATYQFIPDVRANPDYLHVYPDTRSELDVPILSQGGRVVGVLSLESDRLNGFTEDDAEICLRLAELASIAWEKSSALTSYPRGKGVFIRQLALCAGGDPARLAQIAKDAGFAWVAIKVTERAEAYQPKELPAAVQALTEAGIQVWGWGYIRGGDQKTAELEALTTSRLVKRYGLSGFIIDAETEYNHSRAGRWAKAYMDVLCQALPTLPMGLSSFSEPVYQKHFPWKEFLAEVDFVVPQIFWLQAHNPDERLRRSVEAYRTYREDLPIIPVGSAFAEGSWSPTLDEMAIFRQTVQELGLPGFGWYSWDDAEKKPPLWGEVSGIISFEMSLNRLCSTAREAVLWAEGWRTAVAAPKIYSEYLLAGLYQEADGITRRLLLLTVPPDVAKVELEDLVNMMTGTQNHFGKTSTVSVTNLVGLPYSPNARDAILASARLADELQLDEITPQCMLAGFLAVDGSIAGDWIARHLKIEQTKLYRMFADSSGAVLDLDAVQSAQNTAKLTRADALRRLEFIRGDLLDMDVDAIVHPTSSFFDFGGEVGKSIKARLGTERFENQRNNPELRLGKPVVSETHGNLLAKYVIHLPVSIPTSSTPDVHHLTVKVWAALTKAQELKVQSIALPSIGTGNLMMAAQMVAPAILENVIFFLERNPELTRVAFAFIEDDAYDSYVDAYQKLGGSIKGIGKHKQIGTGRRNLYALLVGINDYPPPISKLKGCINDVDAIHTWLEGHVAGEFTFHTLRLIDADATRQAVIDGFRQHLAQAGPEDVALFYYSGHGSQQASPPEFWPSEPDHLDETLVFYDSRLPDGWDLADKETAALIADVAERGAHVLVILDCCHSGSGTRDVRLLPESIRWTPADHRPRPLESFIGPYAQQVRSGSDAISTEIKVPLGRHILLTACRPEEAAKEITVDGQTRGVFSHFLRTTLEAHNQALSYRDLFNQTYERVRASLSQQTPQLEAINSPDVELSFLGGAVSERPRYFTAHWESATWQINAGSIHGLRSPAGGEAATLALYSLSATADEMRQPSRAAAQAHLSQVLPQSSYLEITQGNPDRAQTYRVVLVTAPLPTVCVRLDGEESALALVRAALASAGTGGSPSPYVYPVESGGDLRLLAQDGQYRLLQPTDGHILAPLMQGYSAENAALTVQRMEHIARWITTRDLENPLSALPPEAVRLRILRDGVEMPSEGKIFSYRNESGKWKKPPITVKVTNTSPFILFCAALDLDEEFSISSVFSPQPVVRLEPGQEYSQVIYGSVAEALWRQGISQSQDILKLIACTEPFDSRMLEQGKLDAERAVFRSLPSGPRNPLSRLMRHVQTRNLSGTDEDEVWADWATSQVVVTVQRPLDTFAVPRTGEVAYLGWGVTVEPHPALGGSARLGHSGSDVRDLTGPGLPAILAADPNLSAPFSFQQMRSIEPSPNMIELSGVEDYSSVTPAAPLRLGFSNSLDKGEYVLAYGYDGEFYLPLGVARSDSPRSMQLEVQRLPPPVNTGHDPGGAIRIYFQKVIARSSRIARTYPILAVAAVDAQGNVTYENDSARVVAQVQVAQRITLVLHGITGDSDSLLAAAPRYAPGDLLLAFDYEPFNTSLQENAHLLKQQLETVGLKTGHEKPMRMIAHSTGGLLARWFIEREGGNEIVQHLTTLGTPHDGMPWATAQEWSTLALGLALNSMTTVAWSMHTIGLLLGLLEKNDITLDEINPGSDFLKSLETSDDPHVPYHLLAGNVNLVAAQPEQSGGQSKLERLQQRLGYGASALAFFGQPNDTTVSVHSATNTPTGRMPAPEKIEVGCDHLTFFDSEAGLNALANLPWPEKRVHYGLHISIPPGQLTVGQPLRFTIKLIEKNKGDTFELKDGIQEIYCSITGSQGLFILSPGMATFPIPSRGDWDHPLDVHYEVFPRVPGTHSIDIDVYIEDPVSGRVQIARASRSFEVVQEGGVDSLATLWPTVNVSVGPQPLVTLSIMCVQLHNVRETLQLHYQVSSRAPGRILTNEELDAVEIPLDTYMQIQSHLVENLQAVSGEAPESIRERMLSLGAYLWDTLFPPGHRFREIYQGIETSISEQPAQREYPLTWFVMDDGLLWLPWEIIAPYQVHGSPSFFLCEKFQVGRWIPGLGQKPLGEFPLGQGLILAHYDKDVSTDLVALEKLLRATISSGLKPITRPDTPFMGLHMLRRVVQVQHMIIPLVGAPEEVNIHERDLPAARLSLHAKRPLVSFSVWDENRTSPDMEINPENFLHPDRVFPYLRSGASALVAPWWPTSPNIDKVFWSAFYDILYNRQTTLGEAVWYAREITRKSDPESVDWLAYALFGDPRAQAYIPEVSDGYVALECLDPEPEGNLMVGRSYTVQASIRMRPPIWFQDRLVAISELPESPRVRFLATGMNLSQTVLTEMLPDANHTMVRATSKIYPTQTGKTPLLAQIFSGRKHLTTLQLDFEVHDEIT